MPKGRIQNRISLMKHTYQISGMTCDGCRDHVEKTLKEVEGISDVSVDLSNKEAVVEMESHVPFETLKEAMEKDGGRYHIYLPGSHDHHHPKSEIKKKDDNGGSGEYYCPMLCEGDKKYDKPGDCPKCGMHLEKEESSKTIYTCPMHPEIEQDHPGSCPKCGMDLEPKIASTEEGSEEHYTYRKMLTKF